MSMPPPKPPPPIYKDAQGNVITKEQFDQLNALIGTPELLEKGRRYAK